MKVARNLLFAVLLTLTSFAAATIVAAYDELPPGWEFFDNLGVSIVFCDNGSTQTGYVADLAGFGILHVWGNDNIAVAWPEAPSGITPGPCPVNPDPELPSWIYEETTLCHEGITMTMTFAEFEEAVIITIVGDRLWSPVGENTFPGPCSQDPDPNPGNGGENGGSSGNGETGNGDGSNGSDHNGDTGNGDGSNGSSGNGDTGSNTVSKLPSTGSGTNTGSVTIATALLAVTTVFVTGIWRHWLHGQRGS